MSRGLFFLHVKGKVQYERKEEVALNLAKNELLKSLEEGAGLVYSCVCACFSPHSMGRSSISDMYINSMALSCFDVGIQYGLSQSY